MGKDKKARTASGNSSVSDGVKWKVPFVRGAIYGIFLVSILIVGLYAVPLAITNSGVVAPAGTQYSINVGNARIVQFSIGHPSRMTGSLVSSNLIIVYILNSSQYNSLQEDAYPQHTTYSLGNGSSFSVDATLSKIGVYYLVFYSGVFQAGSPFTQPPISVHVTSALIIRPI